MSKLGEAQLRLPSQHASLRFNLNPMALAIIPDVPILIFAIELSRLSVNQYIYSGNIAIWDAHVDKLLSFQMERFCKYTELFCGTIDAIINIYEV